MDMVPSVKFVLLQLLLCPVFLASDESGTTNVYNGNFTTTSWGINGTDNLTVWSDSAGVTESVKPMNGSAERVTPRWSEILDEAQIALSFIGVVANCISWITLLAEGSEFHSSMQLLLRHQSFIDCVICLFGALIMVLPYHGLSGNAIFDIFLCHAWHGQQIYWGATFVSIWTLVGIAGERYYAVCKPLQHRDITTSKTMIFIVTIYLISIVASGGSYFQIKIDNGKCVSICYFSEYTCGIFKPAFACSAWFTFWVLPCILFVFLYGMVVREFHLRKKESMFSQSKVIDTASKQLTKTAITVTAVFFVCLVSN